MNKFIKLAALAAAVCIASVSLFACGDNAKVTDAYSLIKESTDVALAREDGEILIYESITTESDIEEKLQGKTVETHIRYTTPDDFRLVKYTSITSTRENTKYELVKSEEATYELTDGVGGIIDKVDVDIFENFRLGFEEADIKDVEIGNHVKGVRPYTLTMKKAYIDSFDKTEAGVEYDCTAFDVVYYIDTAKRLNKIVCKYTYTVSADGQSQTVVRVTDSDIA